MSKRKSVSLSSQIDNLRKRLRVCTRKLTELENIHKRLCYVIGYDRLADTWDKHFKNGWVSSWLFPLYDFLNAHIGEVIDADMRNQIVASAQAIITQLAILGKYGVKLPYDVRPFDWQANDKKKQAQLSKSYPPCVLCGETRITEVCHIIPRSEGGADHEDNFLALCPTHHHLFDHNRLTKEEWDKLEQSLDGKMESAVIYVKTVRFYSTQQFWLRSERST